MEAPPYYDGSLTMVNFKIGFQLVIPWVGLGMGPLSLDCLIYPKILAWSILRFSILSVLNWKRPSGGLRVGSRTHGPWYCYNRETAFRESFVLYSVSIIWIYIFLIFGLGGSGLLETLRWMHPPSEMPSH